MPWPAPFLLHRGQLLTPPVAPSPKGTLLAALLLALAIALTWSTSLNGPFVLDDIQNISANPSLRSLADWRQVLSPPANSSAGGRPILNLSFAINHAIGGLSVRGYHVANLGI